MVFKGLPLPPRNLPTDSLCSQIPLGLVTSLSDLHPDLRLSSPGPASPSPASPFPPFQGCQTYMLAEGFLCSVPLPPLLTFQSHYQLPYNPISAPACWRAQPTQASFGRFYTLYKDSYSENASFHPHSIISCPALVLSFGFVVTILAVEEEGT